MVVGVPGSATITSSHLTGARCIRGPCLFVARTVERGDRSLGRGMALRGGLRAGQSQGCPVVPVLGFFLRIVYTWHVSFLVNSVAHGGRHGQSSGDRSRNVWWLGVLAFGDGWHGTHHRYPRSARQGYPWYRIGPGMDDNQDTRASRHRDRCQAAEEAMTATLIGGRLDLPRMAGPRCGHAPGPSVLVVLDVLGGPHCCLRSGCPPFPTPSPVMPRGRRVPRLR